MQNEPGRPPPRRGALGGFTPTLRQRLFRAAAAWLIGWAVLMVLLTWSSPFSLRG